MACKATRCGFRVSPSPLLDRPRKGRYTLKNLMMEDVKRLYELMERMVDRNRGEYESIRDGEGNSLGFVIKNEGGIVFVPVK